jgi:CheY-like chemotaxis protein
MRLTSLLENVEAMKILIADDNDDFLLLITEMLKMYGHIPLVARDGKEAREILGDHEVDVIISDVFMPGLDGVRFHSYVREFLSLTDVPFIFVSGYNDPYTQEGLENSAIDYFISKTNATDDLIETLRRIEASQPA